MPPHVSRQAQSFPSTHWSLVVMAGQDLDGSMEALNELCSKYWRPVYAFVRHLGKPPHDAEDLTQAYFFRLMEREYLRRADREKGRFRSFLAKDLKFFLANELEKQLAAKRGGRVAILSLDVDWAESLHESVEFGETDPDAYFDRQWALETVRLAKEEVSLSYRNQGKGRLYQLLQAGLVHPPDANTYERWAGELGMNPGALKVALHRLRERFREALKTQIQQTVASESELEDEMKHLFRSLSRTAGGT